MATGLLINRNGGYMTIQLEEFLQTAKRRKKKQRLDAHKEDIIKLVVEDVTYMEIQRYLQLKGTKVSVPTIVNFIRRLKIELPNSIDS